MMHMLMYMLNQSICFYKDEHHLPSFWLHEKVLLLHCEMQMLNYTRCIAIKVSLAHHDSTTPYHYPIQISKQEPHLPLHWLPWLINCVVVLFLLVAAIAISFLHSFPVKYFL